MLFVVLKYNIEIFANNYCEVKIMEKYICPCGYEYKVAEGDPDNGVAPNTPWGEVPADWVCPVGGLGKEEFEKA